MVNNTETVSPTADLHKKIRSLSVFIFRQTLFLEQRNSLKTYGEGVGYVWGCVYVASDIYTTHSIKMYSMTGMYSILKASRNTNRNIAYSHKESLM